jgi:N6-L-threonylcarbamoyladenine synthase
MKILGIETSCDDTSVALYDSERGVAENLLSSQVDLHDQFGGVVPELASRAHVVNLLPLVDHLLRRQDLTPRDLDGVAVTNGPGLIGALLVGLSTAKALARAADLPLVGVHHIEGHLLANALSADLVLPAVFLVVSGGHTELILAREVGRYERLGATLDDAAGEAFDKSAKLLGLPYPGGPHIDRLAAEGDPGRFQLPRPLARDPRLVFSFSGLKTAVRLEAEKLPRPLPTRTSPTSAGGSRTPSSTSSASGCSRRPNRPAWPPSTWPAAWLPTGACAPPWPSRPAGVGCTSSRRSGSTAPTTPP